MKQRVSYLPVKCNQESLYFGRFMQAEDFPHFHLCFEMDYIRRGSLSVVVNGNCYSAGQDDILFIPCNISHSVSQNEEDTLCLTLRPTHDICADFHENFRNRMLPVCLDDRDFNRDKLLPVLKNIAENRDSVLIQKGLLNVLFGLILKKYPLGPRPVDKFLDLAAGILNYIGEHSAENLTLTRLADQFGFSKEYFSRLFNSCVDKNLNQYINGVRLERFLEMAEEQRGRSISELVSACGFQSPATFYRTFKEHYGVSPQEYLAKVH